MTTKLSEASGTDLMPLSGPADRSVGKEKATVQKSASGTGNELPPGVASAVAGEQPQRLPQASKMHPHVDVSTQEPPRVIAKQAQRYALPSQNKYPIDNYEQVKMANFYFEEWSKRMEPETRREYCANLVKRASELAFEVTSDIAKYGSASYAEPSEFQTAIDGRRSVLSDDAAREVLSKLAELRPTMPAEAFAIALSEFDKLSGLEQFYDQYIPDPYYSTYGVKTAADEDMSVIVGNDYVSSKTLKDFAKTRYQKLKKTFGDDLADEFRKDPVAIFSSLPLDQKKMVMRMANENAPRDEASA